MSDSIFDKIKSGLEEAIAYEEGTLQARTRTVNVTPPISYNANEIKQIRNDSGLTQVVFAAFMGVSVKTVEAWESGRNHPAGPACRLLALTKSDPAFPRKSGVVS